MSRRRKSNDLIRIEDAIKVLCRRVCHPGIFCPDSYCKEMWELLEDVERVDAVPVVRCRDCKHYEWTANRVPEEQTWWCYKHNTEMGNNDFCSYGKRKGGNDNG